MKTAVPALALLLLTNPAFGQVSTPPPIAPPRTADCDAWKVFFRDVIEHNRASGATTKAALERALDLSYAAYARCVMCNDEALVAASDAIRLVLLSGSVSARASD
jgi:hypothetical protein